MENNAKRSEAQKNADREYSRRKSLYERTHILLSLSGIFFVGLCLSFLHRPTVSQIEKRELADRPDLTPESYFSGEFASKFTEYFSDTVPFREEIMNISSRLSKLKGISAPSFYGNVSIVSDGEDLVKYEAVSPDVTEAESENSILPDGKGEISSPEETEPAAALPPEPEEEDEEEFNGDITEFSNNGIIVDGVKMYGDNAGVMLFGGNKTAGTRYANIVMKYKQALGKDVNVYNMVVPTSVEFYLPKKFHKYSTSQKEAIDHIYNSYNGDIITVDAYSEIAAHTDEYIYLRTDHHWSQRGAYYGYRAFMNTIGMEAPDIDKDYTVKTKNDFVGSLYSYTNDVTLKNSPELFTYYLPKTEYTTYYYDYKTFASKGAGTLFYELAEGPNCYGMFVGGDSVHSKTVTKNETGRKICVFKESYGNALIPFLADNFDEIYVIDIRYFGKDAVQYIKDNGITDVLFINNIFAANTDSLIACIEKLYHEPAPEAAVSPEESTPAETAVSTEESAPVETAVSTEESAPAEAPAETVPAV